MALTTKDGSPEEAADNNGYCARRSWGDGNHTSMGEVAHQGEQKAQLRNGHLLSASLVLPSSCGNPIQCHTLDIREQLSERAEFFVEPAGPQLERPMPHVLCNLMSPLWLALVTFLPLPDLLCRKV